MLPNNEKFQREGWICKKTTCMNAGTMNWNNESQVKYNIWKK
jgi:hypothetical protein